MEKYCKACRKILIRKESEPRLNFEKRQFCSYRCRGYFFSITVGANQRCVMICKLYQTGHFTISQIGDLHGVSTQRIRNILTKHYPDKAEYREITRKNKITSINRLLASQGRRLTPV